MELNERIKESRKFAKMTQAELSSAIKVTRPYYGNVESGNYVPSTRTVCDIARVTGVNESWLITGEGDMTAPPTSEQQIASIAANLVHMDKDSPRYRLTIAINECLKSMTDDEIELVRSIIEKMK